jgi:hypothetical protein
MNQNMCWIWFSPKEIECINDNNATFLFDVLLQWQIYMLYFL